jgi:hypothetical protein
MGNTLAPIVTCLSLLLLAVPAPAEEKSDLLKCSTDGPVLRAVVLKGMLRHVKGELERHPPLPFEYWELHADGKTYYLDLRGKELLERAEKLVNRPVVVTGVPDPSSPTLRVTSLKADEFVKETINVEVRGKLESIRRIRRFHPEEPLPQPWWPERKPMPEPEPPIAIDPDDLAPIIGWRIVGGEKAYTLYFGSELLEVARKLDGKSVIVTGTRVGETINVTGLKADEAACRETVTVEIQGVLGRMFVEEDVWLMCYPPKYGGKVHLPVGWEITANGKTYTLAFGNNNELEQFAANLVNRPVLIKGILKDGVITVTELQPSDPNDWRLLPGIARPLQSR